MRKIIALGIMLLFLGMCAIPPTGGIGGNHNSLIDNKIEVTSDETSSADNDTEYWALLIAVGIYAGHPEEDRPEMLTEVEDLHQKLLISEHWKEENIKVIKGRWTTLLNIIGGFRWLDKREDENDFSLVYITTHGGPLSRDKWPFDEEDGCDEVLATYLSFMFPWTCIRDDFLNLLLSLLESNGVCVIIDSCHAGGFNDPPYFNNHLNDNRMNADEWIHEFGEELSESGRVVLMSCSEDELSQSSVFTPYLIEGLTGYADANEDEFVSAEESLEYVREYCKEYDMNVTIFDDYTGELQLTVVEFPPSRPTAPTGQVIGDTNTTYFYTSVAKDPAGDKISYGWDWDSDFVVDEWTDFFESNTTVNTSHSWSVEGTYNIGVKAKDVHGLESDWSDHIVVMMCSDNIPDQWQKEKKIAVASNHWFAQSFTPSSNSLSKVDLLLNKEGIDDPPPYLLYIRDNLTGDNLAESSRTIPELGYDKYAWFTFDFEDIDVVAGKTYYIVCEKVTGNVCYMWGWNNSDCYPHGKVFNSNDGNDWSTYGGDCCFVTWGKI